MVTMNTAHYDVETASLWQHTVTMNTAHYGGEMACLWQRMVKMNTAHYGGEMASFVAMNSNYKRSTIWW